MSSFPTIAEVTSYLRGVGLNGMALAVEQLEAALARCREANEANFKAVNALRAKYEPQQFRYPDYRSPPESDG